MNKIKQILWYKFFELIILITVCTVTVVGCKNSANSNNENYHWRNLEIGGGGYVTGLYIHPLDSNLIYIRTDVGGAFRYDIQKEEMVQLMNWAGVEEANLYGVYGMALDPVDTAHLFLSAGRYPFASPCDVFESFDKGRTFQALNLNLPMGANKHPEKMGNKLHLHPNGNELWCATYGKGLWIYYLDRKQWEEKFFPSQNNIQSILFDRSHGGLVYISTVNDGIFVSDTTSENFRKLTGYIIDNTDIALNNNDNILFATSRKNGLWAINLNDEKSGWKNINPNPSLNEYRTVSWSDGMLFTAPSKPMGALKWGFYLSTNNGDTWRALDTKIDQHISWHQELFPGSAISDIVVDPSNPQRVFITDWFSVFETKNIMSDSVVWSNRIAKGHEEVVCLNMKALPQNDQDIALYSAHADIGGFAHVKADTTPNFIFKSSFGQQINNLTGLAFCESSPNVVYALGSQKHGGEESCLAKSVDFGKNWKILDAYQKNWGWGRIAVSAKNPNRIVLCTQNNGVCYSSDGGVTFNKSQYAPDSLISGPVFRYNYILVADKVDGEWFYIYSRNDSSFYRSNSFGANWEKVTHMPVPDRKFFENQLDTDYWRLETVPGHTGHLFLCLANQGLYYSVDRGTTWKRNDLLDAVPLMGLGAPLKGTTYPSIYVLARKTEDKEFWYYRSTDNGDSFERMNNSQIRIGNNPQFIEGDRQVFGKVYIGTNGSGIVVGELK
ncbi:MAG: hypothetical protein JXR53_00510 [Bacteroidales bacterium]|nr:hypothetical protein [Bacteroidales bacterium]